MVWRSGLVAVVAAIPLTSCGGEEESREASAERAPAEKRGDPSAEAEEDMREFLQLQAEGDQKGMCAMFTSRNLKERGGRARCMAAPDNEDPVTSGAAKILEDRTTATRKSATVVVDLGKGRNAKRSIPITYTLRYEGGRYKIDSGELLLPDL